MDWNKLLSGRFVFTVVTAGVFGYSVWSKLLDPAKVAEIIMMVIIFYFSRTDRNEQSKP